MAHSAIRRWTKSYRLRVPQNEESAVPTELGKELRRLRIDHNERMLDMAEKIGVSTAFLSAVEVGRKAIPQGFEDKIAKAYALTAEALQKLSAAADQSRSSFRVEAHSPLARDIAGMMARRMETLSEEQLMQLRQVLNCSEKEP